MQNVFAENFFFLGNLKLFSFVKCLSAQERMYANIHISWWMLNRAVMGIFRSKIEVKSSKSFCRGNFLFVPFNALFYVWTMRQCFKNIPAKFQSRPTVLAGFFSKRVTDDDDRRKTFFLTSCCEYSSLIYRVVTMEYRSSGGMCRMAFWTCCSSSRRQSIQFELAMDSSWFCVCGLEEQRTNSSSSMSPSSWESKILHHNRTRNSWPQTVQTTRLGCRTD